MTPVITAASHKIITSWALTRSGQKLTCALIQRSSGTYVLRLVYDGERIVDEVCDSPEDAIARSLDAWGSFFARGWTHECAPN
jgi:hypothetical protein